MGLHKHKKNQACNGARLLISVTVLGSAGPIRFVVSETELVAAVMDTALKSYARQGRLPVLGSDFKDFQLYCPVAGTEALNPWETIGSVGLRNFLLCKMPKKEKAVDNRKSTAVAAASLARKGSGSWKSLFNKSLILKMSYH